MTTRNPLALGLVIFGAVAIAVGAFLPFQESSRYSRVEQNHLIQGFNGWVLVALALGILVTGYRAGRGLTRRSRPPVALSFVAAIAVLSIARDKNLQTLIPFGLNGAVDTSQSSVASALGIAVYVAGAGAAMALIGSFMIYQAIEQSAGIDEHDEVAAALAEATPGVTTATLRIWCGKCQHTQQVPVSANTFQCGNCQANLKPEND